MAFDGELVQLVLLFLLAQVLIKLAGVKASR